MCRSALAKLHSAFTEPFFNSRCRYVHTLNPIQTCSTILIAMKHVLLLSILNPYPENWQKNVRHLVQHVVAILTHSWLDLSSWVQMNYKLQKETQVYMQDNISLQWRHNERHGVPSHRRLDCLLNYLLGCRSRKHQSSASLAFVRGIHW